MRQWAGRRAARQHGGAALEYILVSTFAAVLSVAALAYVGRVVERQLATMAAKLGYDEAPDLGNIFGSWP